jgi:Leucine-rich repeat (LRR) protein
MKRCIVHFSICVTVALLAGCASYDFTVNDKLVYSPKALFSDFDTPDAGLSNCLEQAIVDAKISEASALKRLNCSHAGIETLQGLEIFTGLIQLKLSANKIRNLAPLVSLVDLQELYLDDNAVVDPVPLYPLPALRTLNLSSNTVLQCPEATAFADMESLSLPNHCN